MHNRALGDRYMHADTKEIVHWNVNALTQLKCSIGLCMGITARDIAIAAKKVAGLVGFDYRLIKSTRQVF